jgi:hypothetical protein
VVEFANSTKTGVAGAVVTVRWRRAEIDLATAAAAGGGEPAIAG